MKFKYLIESDPFHDKWMDYSVEVSELMDYETYERHFTDLKLELNPGFFAIRKMSYDRMEPDKTYIALPLEKMAIPETLSAEVKRFAKDYLGELPGLWENMPKLGKAAPDEIYDRASGQNWFGFPMENVIIGANDEMIYDYVVSNKSRIEKEDLRPQDIAKELMKNKEMWQPDHQQRSQLVAFKSYIDKKAKELSKHWNSLYKKTMAARKSSWEPDDEEDEAPANIVNMTGKHRPSRLRSK